MSGERYVVLGLAPARAEWFRQVATWSTDGTLPADFLKCLSVEELRARLASGRQHSAVLLDAASPGLDRDLLAAAHAADCAVLIVGEGRHDWTAVGADRVFSGRLDPNALLGALEEVAQKVWLGASPVPEERVVSASPNGALVAVCGPGGTGASTVAAALAQGLGAGGSQVVLADLCHHAEQAVLHDVPQAIGGLLELVEAHRSGDIGPEKVIGLAVRVPGRPYYLLGGLRRASMWSALRPLAVEAAIRTLRSTWATVVCDVDADVQGEVECGSIDVEERNVLARTTILQARAVMVVGRPGVKGVHALARTIRTLLDAGVDGYRLAPVINGAPRHPRHRAELAAAVAALLPAGSPVWSPTFVPVRKVDAAWRDGLTVPSPIPEIVSRAYSAVGGREREVVVTGARVAPGSLGLAGLLVDDETDGRPR